MHSGTPTAIALALVALTGACSPEEGTSPSPLSIVGQWGQGANLSETARAQTHIHTGYFTFVRQGSGFTGSGWQTGLCRGEGGDYAGPLATGASYEIVEGVQEGDRVSFKSALCEYQGTVSADGAHIDGTARCAYTEDGAGFVWTGAWLANREP